MIHTENLTKLADYLAQLPADYDRFGMSVFYADQGPEIDSLAGLDDPTAHPCGTVACAAGHGPAAGVPVPEGTLYWSDYTDEQLIDGEAEPDAWAWCFSISWARCDNTPHGAAARIRYLLEHGAPPPGFCVEDEDEGYALGLAAYQTKTEG